MARDRLHDRPDRRDGRLRLQPGAVGPADVQWIGFTTEWYRHVFDIADLTGALVNSLELATASTAISLVLGVPLALALARHRFRGTAVVDSTIFVDIAAPSVVVGASLLSFFITLNVARGLLTILVAHVAFNVAYVAVVVRARAVGLDPAIEKAAADLGAGPFTAFRTVTLPLLCPGSSPRRCSPSRCRSTTSSSRSSSPARR